MIINLNAPLLEVARRLVKNCIFDPAADAVGDDDTTGEAADMMRRSAAVLDSLGWPGSAQRSATLTDEDAALVRMAALATLGAAGEALDEATILAGRDHAEWDVLVPGVHHHGEEMTARASRALRTPGPGRRGQALVEFALAVPIFLVMLVAVFDLGRAIYTYNGLSEAAREISRVTAVSGSGPAYFALLAESMIEAGLLLGLSREVSTQLVVQTMLGTAKQLRDGGLHPVELREMVTSPGGTTIAAIHALETAGVRAAFLNAIQAAMTRAKELAAE